MFDDRIGDMQKMLARMGPAGRQKYAADHADDPIAVSMALFVNNIAKELTEGKAADPTVQAPVVQQAIQAMNQPRMPQAMPQAMPQRVPPQGPQQAMPQRMPPQGETRMAADGGYMDSRLPEDMGIGALPERSLANMADGGIVGFAAGGKSKTDPVQDFATKYRSLAEQAGEALGVEPGLIIAQWGHETGWGRGVPGKYNLGNIKGKGTEAYDSLEKSRSQYKNYESPEAFMQDYVSQIKRNFPDAVGAGGDVKQFTKGLQKGRLGAYATDPDYAKKMASAVAKVLPIGSAQAQETAPAAASAANPMASDQAQKAAGTRDATTADLQALRQQTGAGDKVQTAGQVVRSLVQNPLAKILGGYAGIAGSMLPGPEGQGADYAKRAEDYLGYNPEYTKDSKKVLGALNAPSAALSKYVARPAGEFLAENVNPATGAIVQGAIEAAPAALGFLGRFGRGPKAAAPEAAVAAEAPAAAAPVAPPVAPPVRTVPTPAQRAAADTAKPVPQGVARVNQAAQLREQAAAQAAQDAAAAKGPQLPPLVGPPKPAATGIAALSEAAALRTAAEARAKARAAERAAERAAPAAAAAEEGAAAAAAAAAPRTGLAALPEAAGAAVAAEVPAVSRMAAARAAIGEGRGRAALIPAIAAAGAGTGSGASSASDAFDRTSGDDTRGFPTFPAPAALTPEVKKEAVTAATKSIMAGPEPDRLKGLGYEDLLMFGLQLMAGKSQYALQNVGEAGVAALTANQARRLADQKSKFEERKIASDEQKESAMAKYYEKHGNYLDAEAARKALEDKPQLQYQKAVEKAVADAVASMAYQLAKTPAEKAQLEADARARAKASFLSVYPELAGTMGAAGGKTGNPLVDKYLQ